MRRRGLTILEVVIAVILLLIVLGVLLSFLSRGREAAQRVECANHLKLLGEAIYHYHGTPKNPGSGFLPPARIADGYASWPIVIGPYLASKNPFGDWDMQKLYADQTAPAREVVYPVFFCPARDRTQTLSSAGDLGPQGELLPGALGDYACASGTGDPAFPWTGPTANGAIILGDVLEQKDSLILRWQGRTSFDSLKRGLSATFLLGEKHVPLGSFGDAAAGDGSIYNGARPASFARIGGPGYGLSQSPADPFNTNFGSAHPGVCNFLHADGSVKAYANSLDEAVLGKLISRE